MDRGFLGKIVRRSLLVLALPVLAGCAWGDPARWQFPWERRASYRQEFSLPPDEPRYSQFPKPPRVDKETYLKNRRKGLFDHWNTPVNQGPTRPQATSYALD